MTDGPSRLDDVDAHLLSDLGVGIIVVSPDGRIESANERAREFFVMEHSVISDDELRNAPYEVVDERDQPIQFDDFPVIRALRSGRTVSGVTLGLRHFDGSGTRWLLCGAHVVGGEAADLLVVCSFVEVTQQRVALDAVHERDRRFRQLAENAVDMIFRARIEPDLAFEYVNPAVERVLGYPREDFVADFDLAARILHPEDRAAVWAFFERIVADASADDSIAVRMTRLDGAMVWVEIRAVPIAEGGEVVGVEGFARDITALKAEEADLRHLAMHDTLTGIPNRASFFTALDAALERTRAGDGGLAVLYVDLDRFKTVNDGLGHGSGDRVLVALAARLAVAVRPSDSVGRIGGDEFAAVLPGLRDEAEAEQVAVRLLHELGAPLALDEGELVTTACIGVAFTADGRESSAELLRRADVAMYEAKDRGRSRVQCYTTRATGREAATAPG